MDYRNQLIMALIFLWKLLQKLDKMCNWFDFILITLSTVIQING